MTANNRPFDMIIAEQAADSANTGLWSLNLDSNIFWVNQKTRDIFWLTAAEEVTFQRFIDMVHPDDLDIIHQGIRRAVEEGETQIVEYRILLPDGSIRWIQSRGSINTFMDDPAPYLTGISIDITDRKKAELAERQQLRSETLLADISSSFARLTLPEDLDRLIEDCLNMLLDFFGVDRCGLMKLDFCNMIVRITHAAFREDRHRLPDVNYAHMFPWATSQIRAGRSYCFSSTGDLPPEAAADRQAWDALGVKSVLHLPLPVDDENAYLIAITSRTRNIDWPEEFFPRLQLIGNIFLTAIFRRELDSALHRSLDEMMLLKDQLESEVVRLRSQQHKHGRRDTADNLTLEQVEREHIERVLLRTGGRIKGTGGAAQVLGIKPSTLYSRMKKLGIAPYSR